MQQEYSFKQLDLIASTGPRSEDGGGRPEVIELFAKMLDPKVKNANERMEENYKNVFGNQTTPDTFRVKRNGF